MYITVKRYKREDARGKFNIPYGTRIENHDGMLWYNGQSICGEKSAVMREYFAKDDDGKGLERAELTQRIIKKLERAKNETQEQYEERWSVVQNDGLCRRYKKEGQDNQWLWGIDFYNAPIVDMNYIVELVGG